MGVAPIWKEIKENHRILNAHLFFILLGWFQLLMNPKIFRMLTRLTNMQFSLASSKGQLISKANFQAVNSSKKRSNNSFLLLCDVFSFNFWKKLKSTKRHFEIKWPLLIQMISFLKKDLPPISIDWEFVISS